MAPWLRGFIVGKEKTADGRKHWQGYVEFKAKQRPMEIFKRDVFWRTAHWEKAKGNRQQNVAYCSKEGDFVSNGLQVPKPIRTITELRPWQQGIEDMVREEADDRSIHWYWEETGGVGKSAMVKYLAVKHGAMVCAGKAADMKYGIRAWMEAHDGCWPEIVIFDVPRSQAEYLSYQGVEEIKNGCFFSQKYEGGMVLTNPPHVLVFANSLPDMSKWSRDRVVLHDLNPAGPPRQPGYAAGFFVGN